MTHVIYIDGKEVDQLAPNLDPKLAVSRFMDIKHNISFVPAKQQKAVDNLKKKGFYVAIWEVDYVAMMDKKGNPAEVYLDGTIKYPKKR